MTRSLQGPGRDTDPDPLVQLAHRIRDIKRDVNDVTSNVLRMAGLRAEPDLLRVLGSLVVEGSETVSGTLNVTGDTVIGGTLSLPAGIIGNDDLANPVSFAGNKGSVNAVVPPASYGTACTANLTIPSWAEQAVVLAIATVGATAGSPTGGAVTGDILIDGTAGDPDTVNLAAGTSGKFTVLAQRTYNPGGTTVPVELAWYAQNNIVGASARLIAIAVVGR